MTAFTAPFSFFKRKFLDVLFPPCCLRCGEPTAQEQALCATCWTALHLLAPPCCARCGLPFGFAVEKGSLCGNCLQPSAPSPLTALRAALAYDEASRPILLRFKHGDGGEAAKALARFMQRAGAELLADADLLVPVPLHRWRLLRRRYNQAALLARELSALTGLPFAPDLLQRHRATESQGQKNRKERALNVRGAFTLDAAYDIKGLRVLVIDDVMTSGATTEECARVLLASGAASVSALTLARALPTA